MAEKIKARLVKADVYAEGRDQSRDRPWKRRDKAILFVFPKSETGVEQFIYRATRPVKLFRELLPEIFKKLGLPADTKARWSNKAGCSMCPCSPGFVLSHFARHDFYASVTADDPDAVKHDGGPIDGRRVETIERVMAGGI